MAVGRKDCRSLVASFVAGLIVLSTGALQAADSLSGLARISVEPGSCVLSGPRSEQRLIVTGHFQNGDIRDVTPQATMSVPEGSAVRVEKYIVRPVADGTTTV